MPQPECKYPTYLEMDDVTRGDAEQLLASFVRTTVRSPDAAKLPGSSRTRDGKINAADEPKMKYNERSLYMTPGKLAISVSYSDSYLCLALNTAMIDNLRRVYAEACGPHSHWCLCLVNVPSTRLCATFACLATLIPAHHPYLCASFHCVPHTMSVGVAWC